MDDLVLPRGSLLLTKLQKHCFFYAELHRRASEGYAKRSTRLTFVNLLSSIMILFLASNSAAKDFLRYLFPQVGDVDLGELLIAFGSFIVVFTSALQYLLKWDERNLIHKYVSADYANLVRKTARFLAKDAISDFEIHRINRQINALERHSPPISYRFEKGVSETEKKWKDFNSQKIND